MNNTTHDVGAHEPMTWPGARKPLLFELFWPATAGNVAWSFYSVAIDPEWDDAAFWSKLTALALLSTYLAFNWLRARTHPVGSRYFVFDALHTGAIIVFSLATQTDKAWAAWALAAVFTVTIAGHLFNAWKVARPAGKKGWPLALVNGAGLLVLAAGEPWREDSSQVVTVPLSILVVLVLWHGVRAWWKSQEDTARCIERSRQPRGEHAEEEAQPATAVENEEHASNPERSKP